MLCNICKISSLTLLDEIENYLMINDGILTDTNRRELLKKYADNPKLCEEINRITEQDCSMHWNFHQTASRFNFILDHAQNQTGAENNVESNSGTLASHSLTEDIGKDEAEVLYETLNKQSATFNLLTTKINNALKQADDEAMAGLVVHPVTLEMYKEMANSLRLTVREIRDLNSSINGSKNDAFEGLKALAQALAPQQPNDSQSSIETSKDMTTDKFDY